MQLNPPYVTLDHERGTRAPGSGGSPASGWSGMPPVERERLGREDRLRSATDYAALKVGGTALRGQHCMLVVLSRPGERTRVGFIASRKGVGGAVRRNRARRRLREIVRRRWPRVPRTGYWLAFVAYRSTLEAPHQELANDVERLLASAGALAPIRLERP